jgi:uncharacterized membrane protein (UPF0127 family)
VAILTGNPHAVGCVRYAPTCVLQAKQEGLGGRYLTAEHGMLFDFVPAQPLRFWMK